MNTLTMPFDSRRRCNVGADMLPEDISVRNLVHFLQDARATFHSVETPEIGTLSAAWRSDGQRFYAEIGGHGLPISFDHVRTWKREHGEVRAKALILQEAADKLARSALGGDPAHLLPKESAALHEALAACKQLVS